MRQIHEMFRYNVQEPPTVTGAGRDRLICKGGVILIFCEKEILPVGSSEYCDTF